MHDGLTYDRACGAVRSAASRHRLGQALTMHKLKVATVVGTRPEIIRLSRVMAKLDRKDA